MSDLKFAAYGHKFLKNYIKNISIYIRRLKIGQIDNNHDEKQIQGMTEDDHSKACNNCSGFTILLP